MTYALVRISVAITCAALLSSPADAQATSKPVKKSEAQVSSKPTRVRGTNVELVSPAGFVAAAGFTGFAHEESGSSIMISEMRGPFSKVSAGFGQPALLARQGMRLVSSEKRKMGQHDGVHLTVSQKSGDFEVKKAIWVFGTEQNTVLVVGTVLTQQVGVWFDRVEAAVLSAQWKLGSRTSPFEGLGFELRDTQGLEFLDRVSNMVMYSEDGQPDVQGTGKMLFGFGPSFGGVEIKDRAAFVERRVRAMPCGVEVIESKEEIEIDGLKGYAVVASPVKDGRARVVYATLLFEEERYWVGFGSAAAKRRAEVLPKFKKIANSFRRVEERAPSRGKATKEGSK